MYRPPPPKAFWDIVPFVVKVPKFSQKLTVKLTYSGWDERQLYPGIHNASAKYPETMEVLAKTMDFGVLTAPTVMKSMFRAPASPPDFPVLFSQNTKFREIEIRFPIRQQG